jgi:hypothetical protein
VLTDIAVKVEQLVQARGSFLTTSQAGVFICRLAQEATALPFPVVVVA